jgi:DNA recombination protein RmuC
VNNFLPLLEQLQPLSLAVGLGFGMLALVLPLLILLGRSQRRRLILCLRLEQKEKEFALLGEELDRLRQERNQLARECREIDIENASLQTACNVMRQQVEERATLLAQTRRQIEQDFRLLTGEIMNEKEQTLNRRHESTLNALLRPFHDQLTEFKRRVEDVHDREARDRVSMLREIHHLKELNQQVSTEAANLAEALRGKSKLQGLWGEMVLSRLLESSGLRNGREFAVQVQLKGEDGAAYQPDALVYLPENRTVIIDAKVSLKAFANAHQAEDEAGRTTCIRQHLDSIRKHVASLSGKQYQRLTGFGSLDFVLLFIPIEGAFQLAVEQDPELLVHAMSRKVILASPSTLLAILRTIHHLWRMDEQNRNGLAIAKQAGNLYDKLVGFAEAFEEIGLRFNQAQQAWHTARNRLATGQGNIIARTEALKELGVQPAKDLPAALKQTASAQGESS